MSAGVLHAIPTTGKMTGKGCGALVDGFAGLMAIDDVIKLAELKSKETLYFVRKERDKLLAETDWTQLADSSADKVAWATYRQALRDLPQTYANVEDVIWPTKPGA